MTQEELYKDLIEKIKRYHPSQDLSNVEKAYLLASKAHHNQFRKSGEPYILHPLSVSIILAELQLDLESIISGILHDVIEDTIYTFKDISEIFSEEIAIIVDGVTKLDKIAYDSKEEQQAENYRKMFLAMAKDIRVILIKIADRLHNMRTLQFHQPQKQKEIAQETLDLYAPLAHRLGISKLRYELEDLCFKYLHHDEYYDLRDRISRKQSERIEFVRQIVVDINNKLKEYKLEATVEGRPKHFFSIYKKMISKNKTLDQIFDLFAVRIIVDGQNDCYLALGILHEMYMPMPNRFKDYIGMPKSNQYQSLHTTLMSSEGEPFEVQIRTHDMHHVAEYGIAAHWKYKENSDGKVEPGSEDAKLSWLSQILEWQRDLSDNKEYLEGLRVDLNVFKDHVYCFTPKGEVISLINGSTPLDFAYAIHSAVGNKMIVAKVNAKIVTFDYVLSTGDRVEILTSQNSEGPKRDWLKIVKTSQARSKINQWFKKENRAENIAKGKELIEKEAKQKFIKLNDLLNEERIKITLNRFNCLDWDSLCAMVGHGGVKESQVISKLYEEYQKDQPKTIEPLIPSSLDEKAVINRDRKKKSGIMVKGIGDINVRFSKCCTPVPGDEIIGFVTRGRGVSIHRTDCVNILHMDEIDRHRLLDAEWQLPDKAVDNVRYRAELRVIGDDRVGLLLDVAKIITDDRIPVKAISAKTIGVDVIILLQLEINSRIQLEKINDKLKKLQGVHEIERVIS